MRKNNESKRMEKLMPYTHTYTHIPSKQKKLSIAIPVLYKIDFKANKK